MDQKAVGIDQEQRGAVAIEDVGEGRRFIGFPVDCLADENRPTRVRCDKCQAPAHFIVDHVVRAASDDAEKLATLRSLKHGAGSIAPLLGPRPLLVGTPLAIIIIGPEFLKARDLPLGMASSLSPCFSGTIIAVSADTGSGRGGGLGRTASGVSLMNLQRDRR